MFGLIQLAGYKRSAGNTSKRTEHCAARGYSRFNLRLSLRVLSVGLILAIVGGCQSSDDAKAQMSQSDPLAVSALGNVEYHTYILANELFADLRPSRQARYAVAGFVPVDTMKYNKNDQHPLMMLGHQLEQGMMTEATKRGFTTQEFKLSNDIIVNDESDRVLTRNIDQLSDIERVAWFTNSLGLWLTQELST